MKRWILFPIALVFAVLMIWLGLVLLFFEAAGLWATRVFDWAQKWSLRVFKVLGWS